MQTKKIVLIFPFDLLSHYLRCLVLADQYDPKHYRVLFLSSTTYNTFVYEKGYETFEAAQFNVEEVMKCTANFSFTWLKKASLLSVFKAQVAAIQAYQPQIVIGDMAPTLKMAAAYCNVQYISLLNGYLTKYDAGHRALPQQHPLQYLLKFLPKTTQQKLTKIGEQYVFRHIHHPFNEIRKAYGLNSADSYLDEMEGDITYICDLPALFPQLDKPKHVKFIGPLVYQHHTLSDNFMAQIPTDKPVICVTMGSTGNWEDLRFLNDPYFRKYLIVTVADQHNIIKGPHVVAKNFINLQQLLAKADLLICHGGNGTVYQGVLANVFMLFVTNHFEQEWNATALQANNYGKTANQFSEKQWRSNIAEGILITAKNKHLSLLSMD
jgi:UDP:flavonoid glycosyltransferase YjiC (YdhE family)